MTTITPRRTGAGQLRGWAWVAPATVFVGILTVAPLLYGIYLSFTDWSLNESASPSLEGISAYVSVLTDSQFVPNVVRTLAWTIGTLLIEIVVAIPLAMLLNRRTPVTSAVTGLVMIPWITPFVVLAYAWLFLYDGSTGPLHQLFQAIGLAGNSSMLADPARSLLAVIIISGWKGIPFLTIALLAARKSVPEEQFEAAAMDGATAWRSFWSITFPSLRPTLGAMSLVLGVQAFYSFDLVWLLTQGGPGSSSMILGVELYETFFTRASPGEAAALGVIMLILAVVCMVPVARSTIRSTDS